MKETTTLRCGLYPTIITPFFEGGAIDYDGLDRLIRHFARAGCDGLFAVCQSSEMFYLSEEEKLTLAAFCLERCRALGMRCVVSGHTQEDMEAQIAYLRKLEAIGPDAIILVANRLATVEEGDEVLIDNLERICSSLKPETRLGIYECPYPYKRLLTPAVIDAMIASGRFDFLKDTCCDLALMEQRIRQMRGSGIDLYNANSATLYGSVLAGGAGYSGIQLNFTPDIFCQLRDHLQADPPRLPIAKVIAEYISAASSVECRSYPVNAKEYLRLQGIIQGTAARNGRQPLSQTDLGEVEATFAQDTQAFYRFSPHVDVLPLFEPEQHFRRCHASTVLVLDDGTVLCAYFAGDHEKADNVGIWLSRKVEGVWQLPVCIAKVDDMPHWNPVLMKIEGGMRIVFKAGREITAWKSYTMTSADGGSTWTEPVQYPDQADAVGPVRCKPVVLSNGVMLAPNSVETVTAWTVRVEASRDEGASFARLAEIPLNTARPGEATFLQGKGAIQPTLWESKPGHVHALLRTTAGRIFRSDSDDYGVTWCEAYDTGLPNNNSGLDIVKAEGALYLIMNPIGQDWGPRTPLIILRSGDNGRSFSHFVTVADGLFDEEEGRLAEYSYPAIVYAQGALHCTYTSLRRTIAYAKIPCGANAKGG